MPENLVIPCVLDPRRDCPSSCLLNNLSTQIAKDQSRLFGLTNHQFVRILRDSVEELGEKFQASYITAFTSAFIDAGVANDCENFREITGLQDI